MRTMLWVRVVVGAAWLAARLTPRLTGLEFPALAVVAARLYRGGGAR
jgi:hypothetical protein